MDPERCSMEALACVTSHPVADRTFSWRRPKTTNLAPAEGLQVLLLQTWNHITDSAATEFPTVGQVALPGALPQRPT